MVGTRHTVERVAVQFSSVVGIPRRRCLRTMRYGGVHESEACDDFSMLDSNFRVSPPRPQDSFLVSFHCCTDWWIGVVLKCLSGSIRAVFLVPQPRVGVGEGGALGRARHSLPNQK